MRRFPCPIALLTLPFGCCLGVAPAGELSLQAALSKLTPDTKSEVIGLALAATECATAHGQPPSDRLAIIDYSNASTEPRLWVFGLSTRKLL